MPHLYAMVKKRGRQITVKQALTAGWGQDMSPDMGTQALFEFMALVDLTQHVELRPGIEDAIAWTWESSGTFSARSAYRAHFAGRRLIRLRRIYFSNTFALILDSNLHDLNGTNPD